MLHCLLFATTCRVNFTNALWYRRPGIGRNLALVKVNYEVVVDPVVVKNTVDAMKQISKPISLIEGFACQANLPAVNAAVTAARTGEIGKRFVVVAGEVPWTSAA